MGWGVFCTANLGRRVQIRKSCVCLHPAARGESMRERPCPRMFSSERLTLTSNHRMLAESICLTEALMGLEVFQGTPASGWSEDGEVHMHKKAWPPAIAPVTRPLALIDSSRSLCHTIHLVDEETPKHAGKPAGVTGVEIWVKTGNEPPRGMQEMTILALDSGSMHEVCYAPSDAGRVAYYLLRWIGQDETKGPWSSLFCADIHS